MPTWVKEFNKGVISLSWLGFRKWIWPYILFLISGIVRTNAVLDRETTSRYWLTIYARDKGTVPRSSYVEVYVEVQDVNDNTPQTQDPVYYPSVPENSPEGTSVVKLVATDMDSSSNNQVRYAISSGNPQGFFAIDASTGKHIICIGYAKFSRMRHPWGLLPPA